jgi:serine/tyrosine/threonine adenylyltransferase
LTQLVYSEIARVCLREANSIMNLPDIGWHFQNSYTTLPEAFFARVAPTHVQQPGVVILNHALANTMGLRLSDFSPKHAAELFSGNMLPNGTDPVAQAYAGHQFGNFTMLGDGRAILLGEHLVSETKDPSQTNRWDVQLKGAGKTPFSRGGDGRAALGPMLREYIISEAMAALGIPTTRSLAVVRTGEPVFRETSLPGAVLTRVAASHIRVGTFEYVAYMLKDENRSFLKALTDYTIARHYPEVAFTENPALEFLKAVMEKQAWLVAKWISVGFIHGVMNTDNMTISGETIDYGPCAFMDRYDPKTVFSSIDQHGRYAYGNQPQIVQWNLARFAETLLPLFSTDSAHAVEMAREVIQQFPNMYQKHWLLIMSKKLGILNPEPQDTELIQSLLVWMQHQQADFTNTFRALGSETLCNEPFFLESGFQAWYQNWQARLLRQPSGIESCFALMNAHNPWVIPRNHRVEEALSAANENQDYSLLHQLLAALATPYQEISEYEEFTMPPPLGGQRYQTFCGT